LRIQEGLLNQLRGRLMDTAVLKGVRQEIQERQDRNFETFRRDWVLGQLTANIQARTGPRFILQAVESAYPDPSHQGEILDLVVQSMEARGLDPGPLQAALARKSGVAPGEADPTKAPKGTLGRNMVLFVLREEVKRAQRYDYLFSAIVLSIRHAVALKPVPICMIRPHEIRNGLISRVNELLRAVDQVGFIEENKAVVILPLTGAVGVQEVKKRILEAIDGRTLTVRNVPMRLTLAAAEETYLKDDTIGLKDFLGRLEVKLQSALKS
jgi:hypothetical protein